ncbi:Tetratricopeptide TPR_4 [Alloactinosynnema sp. L-07]|uniref:CHAT domain-containing protein n=1 Tax=Alloactinosynnema sp. L-07 TaxID=1653480 RepID=UPI00065EFF15|nr:CHAT domain-containing protein [Alloactinosynnema sp. L-07]CRK60296.1 Tetratricopeptide TPR_4 [Alloactinosynnema sp. L-07]
MTWTRHHAAALAHQERGEPLLAKPHARRALAIAATRAQAAESELVLAWICQQLGDHTSASRLITTAKPKLPTRLRGRADCLTGLRLCMEADHKSAFDVLSAAADAVEDPRWRANALVGAGVSAGYLHRFSLAHDLLDEARALYRGLSEFERAATCLHNKGFVAAQAGEFDRALVLYAEAGIDATRRPEVLVDRANALLGTGRVEEAGKALARASSLLGVAGRGPDFAEATLAHARCALRAGDRSAAVTSAEAAVELFQAQGRPAWADRAVAVRLRAAGKPSAPVAVACERAGWLVEAAELHLLGGRADLVERHRHATSAELRSLGWLARSRTAKTRQGVFAACRAGMPDHRLAAAGLSEAVAGGDPRTVFSWIEPGSLDVAGQLGERALVNLFVHKGQMMAVSVVRSRFRLHELGSAERIVAAGEMLRRGCALAARGGCGEPVAAAAAVDGLVAEVSRAAGDRELVIVPGDLRILWSALPSFIGRPLVVAPSASAWVRADRVRPARGDAVWIAGSGLSHASAEVEDLRTRHGGVAFTGEAATVRAVALTRGARLVHIAAHGRFGPALALADGLLRPADFRSVPGQVVLAACESAGFAESLLARGTASVIASDIPVPDGRAGSFMRAFHAGVASGQRFSQALAEAQMAHGHLGFLCFGA